MLIGDKHDNWDILRKCNNFLLCMLHWNLWKTLLVTNLHVLFYSPYKPYSSPEEPVCLCPGRHEAQPQETVLRLLAPAVVAVPKLRLSGLWVRGRCHRKWQPCPALGRAERCWATSSPERPFHSSRTASNHIPVVFSLARKQSQLWVEASRGTQKPTDNRFHECTAIYQWSGSKLPNSLFCGLKGDLAAAFDGQKRGWWMPSTRRRGASVAPPGQPHCRCHGHEKWLSLLMNSAQRCICWL